MFLLSFLHGTCDWSHICLSHDITNLSPWQRCKHQTFAIYCYFIHLRSQMFDPSWWFSLSLTFLGVKIHFNCDPCVQGRSPLMEIWEGHRGVWMNHHPLNKQPVLTWQKHDKRLTIRPPWIQFLCLMRLHIHDESQWGEPGWTRLMSFSSRVSAG